MLPSEASCESWDTKSPQHIMPQQFWLYSFSILYIQVTDELWILQLFEQWYSVQIGAISMWLGERPALHPQQVACLSIVLKVH